MLNVKVLVDGAKLPTISHVGDLGYDLYALEDTVLPFGEVTKVRTGIAASAYRREVVYLRPLGLLIRDRSSMAAKGIVTSGGVIDSTYTGEIIVLMTNQNRGHEVLASYRPGFFRTTYGYEIKAGAKIAQAVPIEILTGAVVEVGELEVGSRGAAGFGSTGA